MGFVSKHEERDKKLPKFRKNLMDSIEKDLLNDDHVLTLFYGGSIGSRNTDLYSDIDLRIVVKPEEIGTYISNKKTRPQMWGNILFIEDAHPLSIYTVVHYDSFIKVDTFYYKPKDIQPSVWLKNIKIVKDHNSIISTVQKQSLEMTYEPSLDEFEAWRTKFFANLHEAYRRLMRGEYYYALKCIDSLRISIVVGWYMNAGIQPNNFGDWAKYEGGRGCLESWQLSLLRSWDCGRDSIEIMNVINNIVREFKNVHSSICSRLEINENNDWINKIVARVL
ncbi:aminoglycoside 6-adenylyltransferase [Halobacillus sp. A5]|uniref:aminoglycoside 6-adenylyltransferase n=1 Tax=Halobacillus sp. A5 TaxID=2880263 RepID=UPI0020A695E7|nr:aminoglycoside 6-adenylyltransferase [Halobacillus sp. A5]